MNNHHYIGFCRPPLQYFLIEALDRVNVTNSAQLAFQLAQKWITTNFCAWNETLARYGTKHFFAFLFITIRIFTFFV